jgi:hypothetical protein
VLAAGHLALERRSDAPHLAVAALGGAPRPARGTALDLLDGLPLRAGPLRRPAPPGDACERIAGVVQAREGLVGEAGEGPLPGLGRRHARCRGAEALHGGQPLPLNGRVGSQDEGRTAETTHHLDPQQGLARPGGRYEVGAAPAGAPVGLEGLQREGLVVAPLPTEAQGRELANRRQPSTEA